MKKMYLFLIGISVILFFTNPSLDDFQSNLKTSYNEQDGQTEWMIKLLGTLGKLQVCRRNYVLFSVYRSTYKTILTSDEKPIYSIGILSLIMPLNESFNFLGKGSYSKCISIKTADLK
jgi:hypothetical protein